MGNPAAASRLTRRRGEVHGPHVLEVQQVLPCRLNQDMQDFQDFVPTTSLGERAVTTHLRMIYAASLVARIRASASQTHASGAQFDRSWCAMRRRARSFHA